jgi:DNA-binding MarR family transcriptional regulator
MSLCFLSFDSGKIYNKLILEYVTNSGFDGLSEALILLFPYIEENEKVTASQLSKIVGYSRQAMHKNIKKLKELDYITLIEENQKEKSIQITAKGRKLMHAANQYILDIENKISEVIGEEELNLYKKNQMKIYEYLNTQTI